MYLGSSRRKRWCWQELYARLTRVRAYRLCVEIYRCVLKCNDKAWNRVGGSLKGLMSWCPRLWGGGEHQMLYIWKLMSCMSWTQLKLPQHIMSRFLSDSFPLMLWDVTVIWPWNSITRTTASWADKHHQSKLKAFISWYTQRQSVWPLWSGVSRLV